MEYHYRVLEAVMLSTTHVANGQKPEVDDVRGGRVNVISTRSCKTL